MKLERAREAHVEGIRLISNTPGDDVDYFVEPEWWRVRLRVRGAEKKPLDVLGARGSLLEHVHTTKAAYVPVIFLTVEDKHLHGDHVQPALRIHKFCRLVWGQRISAPTRTTTCADETVVDTTLTMSSGNIDTFVWSIGALNGKVNIEHPATG
jgi:hypothetical protein